MNLWSPHIHFIATFIHIFCAISWLGWMVFMFAILRPVVKNMPPQKAIWIQAQTQQRIRRIVFWLIPLIILTGLYNMSYRGLLDWELLMNTNPGHRMLLKLGAAGLLFGIYYGAPFLLWLSKNHLGSAEMEQDPEDCHGNPDPLIQKVSALLHIVAFTAGLTAAYLGISIGG